MHIVLQFLLIYELRLAVCVFSPYTMVGFLKKNMEIVEQNPLQNALSCSQKVMHGENITLKSTQLYLMFVPHGKQ